MGPPYAFDQKWNAFQFEAASIAGCEADDPIDRSWGLADSRLSNIGTTLR
jgi:hypothetical protein